MSQNNKSKDGRSASSGSTSEDEMQRWAHRAFLPSSDYDLHMKIWEDLSTQIQFFVKLVFPPEFSWNLVDDSIKAQLLAISPWAAEFFDDEDYREFCEHEEYREICEHEDDSGCWLLFEAWIWRILYENLFSLNCRDKWSGAEWAAFGCLRQSLGDIENECNAKTIAYHAGRHNLARDIYLRHGPHTCPERLERIIMLAIKPIVVFRNPMSSPDLLSDYEQAPTKRPFEDALSEMVGLAIEADFNIVASPYDTRIEMHDPETGKNHDFLFKPGPLMEARESPSNADSGMPVDFIVRPMLRTYKRVSNLHLPSQGDPDYQHNHAYDSYHCERTKPMDVVVNYFGDHGHDV